MNFPAAVKSCFKKYFTCGERASRSEFWYWTLFIVLGTLLFSMLDVVVFHLSLKTAFLGEGGPFNALFTLVTFIPGFCVTVRRLHDVNRSGWWQLIALTVVGLIPLTYWLCKKGTTGDNRFGPDPLAPQMIG